MAEKIRFGVYELDRDAVELRKRGVPIRLQEQPFRVLVLLAELLSRSVKDAESLEAELPYGVRYLGEIPRMTR